MIEPLPEGHPHTCDKLTGGGWSRNNADPDRCGKPAVVIDRQTCNCGQCDMSSHLCEYHARRYGTAEERREDDLKFLDHFESVIEGWPDSDGKEQARTRLATLRRDGFPKMQVIVVDHIPKRHEPPRN